MEQSSGSIVILPFLMSEIQISLVLALCGHSKPPVVGHRDVTGFCEALGDAAILSRLTVALHLTSLEKAKYRDPCWSYSLENQRHLGH